MGRVEGCRIVIARLARRRYTLVRFLTVLIVCGCQRTSDQVPVATRTTSYGEDTLPEVELYLSVAECLSCNATLPQWRAQERGGLFKLSLVLDDVPTEAQRAAMRQSRSGEFRVEKRWPPLTSLHARLLYRAHEAE